MAKENLTLGAIVNKIRIIADTKYDGELDGNLSTIFASDLSLEERRALLFFMMTLYVIFESHITHQADSTERIEYAILGTQKAIEESADRIRESAEDVKTYNAKSLIDLKNWIAKLAAIGAVGVVVTVTSLAIVFDRTEVFGNMLKPVWEILTMMFGG